MTEDELKAIENTVRGTRSVSGEVYADNVPGAAVLALVAEVRRLRVLAEGYREQLEQWQAVVVCGATHPESCGCNDCWVNTAGTQR